MNNEEVIQEPEIEVGDIVMFIGAQNQSALKHGDEFEVLSVLDTGRLGYGQGVSKSVRDCQLVSKGKKKISSYIIGVKDTTVLQRTELVEVLKANRQRTLTDGQIINCHLSTAVRSMKLFTFGSGGWGSSGEEPNITLVDFLAKFEVPKTLLHQKWKDLYDDGVTLQWSSDGQVWHSMDKGSRLLSFDHPHFTYRTAPQLEDCVIDIEDTSFADRIRLRQVLISNGQKLCPLHPVHTLPLTRKANKSLMLFPGDLTWTGSGKPANISLEEFIQQFKKNDEVRNLSVYKRNNRDWTQEEADKLFELVGAKSADIRMAYSSKYFFDDGETIYNYYYPWTNDHICETNRGECLEVSYEELFPESSVAVTPAPALEPEVVKPKYPFAVGDTVRSLTYVNAETRIIGSEHEVIKVTSAMIRYIGINGIEYTTSGDNPFELVEKELLPTFAVKVSSLCQDVQLDAGTPCTLGTSNQKENTMNNSVNYTDTRPQPETFQEMLVRIFGQAKVTDLCNRPDMIAQVFDREDNMVEIIAIENNKAAVKMLKKEAHKFLGYTIVTYSASKVHTLNIPVSSENA